MAVQGRLQELDGLRGVAAVAVLVEHYTLTHNAFYPDDTPSPWKFTWGEYGVQLFFLVSGFVILMTAERAKSPSDFVISRISRLYPAYWFAVIISSALVLAFDISPLYMEWWQRLANLMMTQRWFLIPNVDLVYWTLAVEMQFYALLLILLIATRCSIRPSLILKAGLTWVMVGLIVALAVGAQTRGIAPSRVDGFTKVLLNITLAEQSALFVGGMFAYLGRRERRFTYLSWAMGGVAVLLAGLIKGIDPAIAVAVVAVLFFWVISQQKVTILRCRPVQFYGRISYSLYVQHAVTGLVLMHLLIPVIGRVPAMLATALIVTLWCWLVHEFVEVRASRVFKGWLLRSRRPVHATAQVQR